MFVNQGPNKKGDEFCSFILQVFRVVLFDVNEDASSIAVLALRRQRKKNNHN